MEGGNPTGGVGHKLTDQETKQFPVGTKLSEEKIKNWFQADWERMTGGIEKNPVTSGLEGGQKEAMTDFAFNGLANKVGGFKKESNENFFLNFLGGDRGLLRRRIGQTILYRSNQKYNFDFIRSTDSQKQVEESSKSN